MLVSATTRIALLGLLLISCAALAEPDFPKLSGRVVDNANMLTTGTERALNQKLAAHEQATGNQVVVVTLKDLQGENIEDYGYQLGRHWGIGQKGKDNGALLIIAEQEREMRIEVGYGLEGQLTDAVSAQIIFQIISPAFKQGQFDASVTQGVDAMIKVLGGAALPQRQAQGQSTKNKPPALGGLLMLFVILMMIGGGGGRRGLLGGLMLGSILGSSHRGGFGGGGFGGGFGGGGGGFGGGGASGGW